MAKQKVRKAVIAAAGFGTRFLPQTKAMPKEMLPLVDKPIIQYIVEDLVQAGITDIIIVTGYSKRSIEDHFDIPNQDLLANLQAGGPSRQHYIEEVKSIAGMANFAYVRQKGLYGTATPVHNAAHLIGDEPFIYTFADDFFVEKPNVFKQMINLYEEFGGSVLPCMKLSDEEDYSRYGMVGVEQVRERVMKVTEMVEKPGKTAAPSDYAIVGGYLLTPDIFEYIEKGRPDVPVGREFYINEYAMQPMLQDGKNFCGYEVKAQNRYDTGNPLGYVKTVIDLALKREDMGVELREFLTERLS